MNIIKRYLSWIQDRINRMNREKLINRDISLICSNCTGGVLYHWLNLEFKSPFINLYMDNKDFLTALENFDEFLDNEILEDTNSDRPYPVGIGCHGERIYFMHYKDFSTAIQKWNIRKSRINRKNIAIILANFGSGLSKEEFSDCFNGYSSRRDDSIINRFERLPFHNKIILSGYDLPSKFSFTLKGFPDSKSGCTIFRTQNILGKRYIDQFDYVSFINNCCKRQS